MRKAGLWVGWIISLLAFGLAGVWVWFIGILSLFTKVSILGMTFDHSLIPLSVGLPVAVIGLFLSLWLLKGLMAEA